MAFTSPTKKAKKGNLPDNNLVIKINTSKGYITLGRIGLYNESTLHAKVAQLTPEQLSKLLSNAQVEVVPYESSTVDDSIELII